MQDYEETGVGVAAHHLEDGPTEGAEGAMGEGVLNPGVGILSSNAAAATRTDQHQQQQVESEDDEDFEETEPPVAPRIAVLATNGSGGGYWRQVRI